jgi:three-Cys-motif partner protein
MSAPLDLPSLYGAALAALASEVDGPLLETLRSCRPVTLSAEARDVDAATGVNARAVTLTLAAPPAAAALLADDRAEPIRRLAHHFACMLRAVDGEDREVTLAALPVNVAALDDSGADVQSRQLPLAAAGRSLLDLVPAVRRRRGAPAVALDEAFFAEKRPWSRPKDAILQGYIRPYLAKVAHRGRPIHLVDLFAGPGVFGDGQPGSPAILLRAAEETVPGRYRATLVNRGRAHHRRLEALLDEQSWERARAVPGDARIRLADIVADLGGETALFYCDPYGLGLEFDVLAPILRRDPRASTEIVLTICMPVVHRLAACHQVAAGVTTPRLESNHRRLTRHFGGDYWRAILLDRSLTPQEKERRLIAAYCDHLRAFLPQVGACPVHAYPGGPVKYFIIVASRHPDALVLMNDIMLKAYEDYLASRWPQPMALDPTATAAAAAAPGDIELEAAILGAVRAHPGATRAAIWRAIIECAFMRWRSPAFRREVERLEQAGRLISPTPRPTRRLNDRCALWLPEDRAALLAAAGRSATRGVSQPTATTVAGPAADEIGLLNIAWSRALADLRREDRRLFALVQEASPMSGDGGTIVVHVPYPFHRDQLSRDAYSAALARALGRHLGTTPVLQIALGPPAT